MTAHDRTRADRAAPARRPPADLLEAATAAWRNAYAPYSRFHVGAALRGRDGTVFAGANVENASFGLSRCAEQSAVQAMATAGERAFSEIVVVTLSTPAASPCGACRQVLYEFGPDATVWCVDEHGEGRVTTVRELLPDGFSLCAPDGAPDGARPLSRDS